MSTSGELSVFVDESGSFDSSIFPSRFYVVTLLFHWQIDSIVEGLAMLESQLGYCGYPNVCVHAGPLLRREEDFRTVDIQDRRKILGRMLAFTRHMPVSYASLCVDKAKFSTPESISEELIRQLDSLAVRPEGPLLKASRIKVYYDNGQDQVLDVLRKGLSGFSGVFKPEVSPSRYRLFQAADLICTIELLRLKILNHLPLNKSEVYFFGSLRELKKNYINPISRLSLA